MKPWIATIAGTAIMLASMSTHAAEMAKSPASTVAKSEQRFQKGDANQDGFVSAEEFRARGDAMFKEIDRNADGKLSPEETKAHRAARYKKKAPGDAKGGPDGIRTEGLK